MPLAALRLLVSLVDSMETTDEYVEPSLLSLSLSVPRLDRKSVV